MNATSMQLDHVYAVTKLDSLCYPEMPLDQDSVGLLIKDINTSGYVVFDDQKLVAYVIYDVDSSEVRILRMGVHPEYRGRGLAWRLLNRLKSKIHVNKPRLIAAVPDNCVLGHKFLARQGFVARRVIKTPTGDSYEFVFRAEWKERDDDEQRLMHTIDTTQVDL